MKKSTGCPESERDTHADSFPNEIINGILGNLILEPVEITYNVHIPVASVEGKRSRERQRK